MMVSQKPYLIRAIYEWCLDSSLTPFISAQVDAKTSVPVQYVQNGRIVLNISPLATKDLEINFEWMTFEATCSGVIHSIAIPIANIIAIFAQENGQGMQFNPNLADNNGDVKKSRNLYLVK